MVDVRAIGQEHISKRTLVLVVAVRLEGDLFPEGEGRGGVLGVVARRLALRWAIYPAETDAFSVVVVQDFGGVAVSRTLSAMESQHSCVKFPPLPGAEDHGSAQAIANLYN